MELDQLLDLATNLFSKVDVSNLYSFYSRNPTIRPTLSLFEQRDKNGCFGPEKIMSLEVPSSDEESDEEAAYPSDEPILVNYHLPTLIVCGLDPRVSSQAISSAIYSLGYGIHKVVLVEFGEDPSIHTALVYFDHIAAGIQYIAKEMYTKLRKYEKADTLGSRLHMIPGALIKTSVRWFCHKVLDPAVEWTAVVCRGLNQYKNPKELQNKLGRYCLRVEIPRYINYKLCTIIVVPSLIEAKKILLGYQKWGLAEKVHIHPRSSVFKRPDLALPNFFKEFTKADISALASMNYRNENEEDVMSPISSSEEGEITNGEHKQEETGYQLYELAGQFITKTQEISNHSGVFVKTSFNSRLNELPNN